MGSYRGDLHQAMRDKSWDMQSDSLMETRMTLVLDTGVFSDSLKTLEGSGQWLKTFPPMVNQSMLM